MKQMITLFLAIAVCCTVRAGEVADSIPKKHITAISTNIVDWGWFLTPNISVQVAPSRHWTITADAKWNKWTYNDTDWEKRTRHARQEYGIGFKWWSWFIYSGWWLGARAQYREYCGSGLTSLTRTGWNDPYIKEEGDAVGLALSFGYSLQINRWFNLDFGLGIWGGHTLYKQYYGHYILEGDEHGEVCPRYGKRCDASPDAPPSRSWFFGPNEIIVSAMFIF